MPSTGPAIQGLSAVTVHITDVARARRFYGEVLGLEEKEFQPERQRLVYALPGTSTLLTMHVMTDPREEGRPAGTVSGIVFSHSDPAAALNQIHQGGGTVVAEAMKMPWGLVRGVFADPDGNEFILAGSR
jgi:predicted enzyme related to lactoylglutathione lyase